MALETMRVSYYITMNIIWYFLKIDLKLSKSNDDGHTSLWKNEGLDHHISNDGQKSKKGGPCTKLNKSSQVSGVEYNIWPKGRHHLASTHYYAFQSLPRVVLVGDLF